MQRKYENEVEKQQELRVEEQVHHKKAIDKLQFELDFYRKELETHMR